MLADIDPGCRCLDQHARVNGRVEQSERANDALDIHAVANLEQPVGDGVPIAQHLVVARDAEVEGAPDAEERAGIPRRCRPSPNSERRD